MPNEIALDVSRPFADLTVDDLNAGLAELRAARVEHVKLKP
ncbi:MAG: hypothetical protein ACRD9W_06275 [Terriglobia bacterium]